MKRLALITGASSGIGAAFAQAYAARGCDVCLVARRVDKLEALAARLRAEHGVEAFAIGADLAVPECHVAIVAALEERGRAVDILINNAGYSLAQRFLSTSWEAQRDFVQVLVTSAIGLTHALLPAMVSQKWGRVINVASMVAFSPGAAGHTLYPAAKSFMVKMSQSLAAEVGAHNVSVTAICPGQTESEFASANGTADLVKRSNMFTQTADDVVAIAIRANEAGREVVVPGWPNKLAVLALKLLPDTLTAALIRPQAAKFVLPD